VYYPFNSDAIDASGFNNHGQITGGVTPTHDRFGNPCSALEFDGSSGYIEVPSSPSLESPTQQITICLWYKLSFSNNTNLWLTAACKGAYSLETPDIPQYRLQTQQNLSVIPNTCSPNWATTSSTISLNTAFTECDMNFAQHPFDVGVWHFYALTYDGAMVRAFMDDVLVFEYPFSEVLEPNNLPLFIGKDEPGLTEYYSGSMDDLRIYNYALSKSELSRLFNQPGKYLDRNDFDVKPIRDQTVKTPSNQCSVRVSYPQPNVQSNCGSVTLTQLEGLPSGSMFPVGHHRIRFQITSPSGYTEVLTSYINVYDPIPPILIPPNDTTITIPYDQDSVLVDYSFATASDNCGIKTLSITQGDGPGTFFKVGKHTIRFRADDLSDNFKEASFTIQILKAPPVTTPITQDSLIQPPPPDSVKISTQPTYTDTLSIKEYKGNNILFLLDVSSSMLDINRIDILKAAMQSLIPRLRSIDRLTILTYATDVRLLYPPGPVLNKPSIIETINSIVPKGSTAGQEGIARAYRLLDSTYVTGLNTEIYLVTDGIFDLSKTERTLVNKYAFSSPKPIRLNFVAIKASTDDAEKLEKIATSSKGSFILLRTKEDADKKLLEHVKQKSKN
jgi:Mg-chelatase subunit ChlD